LGQFIYQLVQIPVLPRERVFDLFHAIATDDNPKKQRRPTFTAKEMATLLPKAEGQYRMIYFSCVVTGLRVSETVAIEIDKHIEPDCSIVRVRPQREETRESRQGTSEDGIRMP
jgi:integrase